MQGRFHDGRTAAGHRAELSVEGPDLRIMTAGLELRWPLAKLVTEPHGDEVRLSLGRSDSARLILSLEEWRRASGLAGHKPKAGTLRRQLTVVAALALTAAGLAGSVFILLPAAAGPLAAHTPPDIEAQMGENFDAQVSLAFHPCPGQAGQAALADLGKRLQAQATTPFDIRVRAVNAPIANAFALPGGSIIVTDGLIDLARTPDELAAVISHEVAHVEKRHVMQAVWRSLGLGLVLDALVGGGSGAGQQAVLLAGSMTNLRYTRQAETEADARGQQLLERGGLSSAGMAPFFARLATKGEGREAAAVKELLSDHPDIARRADAASARAHAGAAAWNQAEWRAIKQACAGQPNERRLRRFF